MHPAHLVASRRPRLAGVAVIADARSQLVPTDPSICRTRTIVTEPQMSMLPVLQAMMPPTFCQYAGGRCDQPFDHFKPTDIFAAYASEPQILSTTIDSAIDQLRRS